MGMILVITAEPATAAAANLLFALVARRYERGSIVLHAITAADLPQLQQLDRSRADIDAD